MGYGPSQLDYSFLFCASMITSFINRFPSFFSFIFTLELYLLVALCFVATSQIWMASCSLSISSVSHFKPISFASSFKCARLHEGVSISMRSIYSSLLIMENRVSCMVDCGVLWYEHSILWSNFAVDFWHRLVSSLVL